MVVSGVEGRPIVRGGVDQRDFCAQLGTLVVATGMTVHAWTLPNHAHLLYRTGARPLARCMRSLLSGCAGGLSPICSGSAPPPGTGPQNAARPTGDEGRS